MKEKYNKNNYIKCLKKCPPSEKREIMKAFEKLRQMISIKESYGVPFEKIFNDETLKYDILGKNFYVYKAHGKDRAQIRILYKFIRIAEKKFDLELHQVVIKRKTNKEYIKEFREYVKCCT